MKTLVYWIGLILIGFGTWLSLIALWIYWSIHNYWRFGNLSWPVILILGAIIFIAIGWRMIKEGR